MINIQIKIKLLLCLLQSSMVFSQLTLKWELKNNNKQAVISVKNSSDTNIAVPLDIRSLQGYISDNYHELLSEENTKYPFLALRIAIFDSTLNKRLNVEDSVPYLNISTFEENRQKIDAVRKNDQLKLETWKKKNRIINDSEARINHYLFKNIILLKPKENLKFVVAFNLRNITNQEDVTHYSYSLKKNKEYTVFLSLNVEDELYKYLTTAQKQKLKKYNLFKGKIESNAISFVQDSDH